jgi:hypothetical protein
LPSVAPVHLYDFNGSLADQMGGPALIADGGTLVDGHYVFGMNQGLRLSGALADPSNYSIVLVGQLSSLANFWNKVIDFQERTSDAGLYVAGSHLTLYPGAAGPDTITANQDFQLTLTRDGASGETDIYLNGVLQQIYSGAVSSAAIPSNNVLTFFEDDKLTISEATAGSVDSIAIYDRALTAAEVANLTNPPVASPTITVTAPGGVYNGLPYAVTAAVVTGADNTVLASLGDPSLSYKYYVGTTISDAGSANVPQDAGTYTVVAHWTSDNSAYASADSAPTTFSITPAALIITADSTSKTYGQTVTFAGTEFSASGLVGSDSVSSVTLASAGAVATATVTAPGPDYDIVASAAVGGGLGNYTISYVNGNLHVNAAVLTITANDQTKITGEANPTFTASYSGFVLEQGIGVLGGTLTFSTSATAASPPGCYAIIPSGPTSGNYVITFGKGTLTVLSYAQATTNLLANVNATGLDNGNQSALDSKLQSAITYFAAGDTTNGVGQLSAFINYLNAQCGKKIAVDLADSLMGAAQRIISARQTGDTSPVDRPRAGGFAKNTIKVVLPSSFLRGKPPIHGWAMLHLGKA